MNDPGAPYPDRIPVGGIRFSTELVLLCLRLDRSTEPELGPLLTALAGARINLPFVCRSGGGAERLVRFCVDAGDWTGAQTCLAARAHLAPLVEITAPAATLTLFPHRNSLLLLGRLLGRFGSAGLRIHGFCSSISALTFCVDYERLDEVAGRIRPLIELPDNHAPFRPEFVLKQPGP